MFSKRGSFLKIAILTVIIYFTVWIVFFIFYFLKEFASTTKIYWVAWEAAQWKQSLLKIVNIPVFPHLLSDFGEFRFKRSAYNGVKDL
jgi:ABC-type cobalamin transport system permease subunit